MKVKLCEDGKAYILMPLPEGISQEEVNAAVTTGQIKVLDGMMTDEPQSWEVRDGELWWDGQPPEHAWQKVLDTEGFLLYATFRFAKQK
ncbi:MAG: hypothetical protein IJU92_07625 [Spirochaetaceae bacterium]|nr:hypothetical protein [Spirochaetaceae bacterium]